MTESEDDQVESNMTVVLAGCIGGFLGIIISLVVCYIKRWCCFAVSLLDLTTIRCLNISLFSAVLTTRKM